MMGDLIYQVKVGKPPAFYDICVDSVAKYCQKYGIRHVVQTTPILKIRPINSRRSKEAVERLGYLPIYEKENAFNYLDHFDRVAIIDADIYIKDDAPNIFNELGDTTFAAVVEREMPLTPMYRTKIRNYSRGQYGPLKNVNWGWTEDGARFYNMGVMLFSKKLKEYLGGQTPEEFIRRKEFERFVNGDGSWKWSTDQTLLNYWVRTSGMSHKHLNWRYNALFKGILDDKLKDAYFIHFFLSNVLPKKGAEIPGLIKNLNKAREIGGHK